MQPEDAIRVQHMIEAAEAVQSFIAGRRRIDLDSDRMLLFALVRAVEIIGEAASKLGPEARAAIPSVPWASIVAMPPSGTSLFRYRPHDPMEDGGGGDPSAARCSASWLEGMGAN